MSVRRPTRSGVGARTLLAAAATAALHSACTDDSAATGAEDVGLDSTSDGSGDGATAMRRWEVTRDAWGVPHVVAPSRADAFFAQGYETARDRLWHMDFMRHFVYGTQASVYGPAFVEDDQLKRGLDLRRFATENVGFYEANHPSAYAALAEFSAGVNAYIADAGAGRNGAELPSEFSRIPGEYSIAAWTPADSIAIARALVLSQSFQPDLELAFFAGNTLMGPRFREMFPFTPLFATHALEESPTPDSALSLEYDDAEQKAPAEFPLEAAQPFAQMVRALAHLAGREDAGPRGGSNAWAVAGNHTASGAAILCNDTHMSLDLPSNLYPMHLVAQGEDGFDSFGYNGPGHPMTLIGTNMRLAWGLTNAYADVTDLYRETLSDDGLSVEFGGRDVPLDVRDEIIAVRQPDGTVSEDLVVRIRWVPHHGPLLNDLLPPEIGDVLSNFGFVFSVRWMGFRGDAAEFAAFDGLLRSGSVDQGLDALGLLDSGVMNLTLADSTGDIAYVAAGAYPQRPWDLVAAPPYAPLEGRGGYEWGPRIPWSDVPRLVRPAKGYLVNANASIGPNALDNNPETGDFYFSHFLDLGTRAWRITELLEDLRDRGGITLGDLTAIHADSYSVHAQVMLPVLLEQRDAICAADPGGDACAAVDELASWDRMQTAESVAATVFNAWVLQFMWDTYVDDTQDLVQELLGPELDNSAGRGVGHWLSGRLPPSGTNYFDDSATPDLEESAADIAVRALDRSLVVLRSFYGPDVPMSDWAWSSAHQVTWQHQVWDDLDVGPRGMPSGFRTVNAADYRLVVNDALATPPYQMNEGPGIRFCVELGNDTPRIVSAVNGGTSGHSQSPHFADMLDLWVAGQSAPVELNTAALAAAGYEPVSMAIELQ